MMERDEQGRSTVEVVVITGPVGAGKSTTARAVAEELNRRRLPHALIDMDFLRWVYPAPEDDWFNGRLGLRNLGAIWPNLQDVGVEWIVVADVVEHPDGAQQFRDVIPGSRVTVVRLNVPLDLVMARLEVREGLDGMEWFRNRAPELQGIMEREGVGDLVVEVGERTPGEVAGEILLYLNP
jgi:adenylylsulfate kinase-like enzyme